MSNSTYEVRQSEIKVFVEANRLDFLLQQPGKDKIRATVFKNKLLDPVKLDSKKLSILPPDRNEDGSLKNPNRLTIKWGRQILNLGFVAEPKGGAKPYFFRTLESEAEAKRPKTVEDVYSMMGFDE